MKNPLLEWRTLFPAVITQRTRTSGAGVLMYRYSWVEQYLDAQTGKLTDAKPARQGSANYSPAYEMNGAKVEVGTWVWMRMRGFRSGQPLYEFLAPGGSANDLPDEPDGPEITYRIVSKVCPTITNSRVTDLTIETRTVTFPAGTVVSAASCESGNGVCCGTGDITACGRTFPATLYATITTYDDGGGTNTCSCANGTLVTLTYDSDTSKWVGSGTLGSCGYSVTLSLSLSGSTPGACTYALTMSTSNACYTGTGTDISPSPGSGVVYKQFQFGSISCPSCTVSGMMIFMVEITE